MNEWAERFWAKVDKSGGPDACWPWQGTLKHDGYGWFSVTGVRRSRISKLAHRVAFFLTHGRYPEPCCCHHCDSRPCCNPAHLFEGTIADNNADMRAKGRDVPLKGEANGRAKLTAQDVLDIRATFALCRVSKSELGRRYGVNHRAIGRLIAGESWSHIP